MVTQDTIEQFYQDLRSLGLKFPVAAISQATGITKGTVSKYLSRQLEPSETFIKLFYEKVYKPRGTSRSRPLLLTTPIVAQTELETLNKKYLALLERQVATNNLDDDRAMLSEILIGIEQIRTLLMRWAGIDPDEVDVPGLSRKGSSTKTYKKSRKA